MAYPEFLRRGGGLNPQGGCANLLFLPKTACKYENERNWTRGGGASLRSATDLNRLAAAHEGFYMVCDWEFFHTIF